jgi:hypothetical protein
MPLRTPPGLLRYTIYKHEHYTLNFLLTIWPPAFAENGWYYRIDRYLCRLIGLVTQFFSILRVELASTHADGHKLCENREEQQHDPSHRCT